MFSVNQKRQIADAVQKILRDTHHPELPTGEIRFLLHVDGAESWSWADIRNNGAVTNPGVNQWNEEHSQPTTGEAGDHDRTHTILPNGRCQQHPKGCIMTPEAADE